MITDLRVKIKSTTAYRSCRHIMTRRSYYFFLSSDFVPSVPQLTETTLAPRKARYISFNISPQRIRFASLLRGDSRASRYNLFWCFGASTWKPEHQNCICWWQDFHRRAMNFHNAKHRKSSTRVAVLVSLLTPTPSATDLTLGATQQRQPPCKSMSFSWRFSVHTPVVLWARCDGLADRSMAAFPAEYILLNTSKGLITTFTVCKHNRGSVTTRFLVLE
jgi:hypothetical protein